MHVLVVCADPGVPLYGPSGASEHVRAIVRAFRRRGDDVRVATALAVDARGAVAGAERVPGAVHHPPGRWPRGLRTLGARHDARGLARRAVADGWRPDLIWERHAPHPAADRLARRLGVPRYLELDAPLALERAWGTGRPARRRAIRREQRALRTADRIVAVSAWLARWAVHAAGCDRARVRHVPNGVEPGPPGDREAVRARLGLAPGVPVLGFVGSFRPWHGADRLPVLLDALGAPWQGLAVGDGPCPPAPHPRLVRVGRVPPAAVPDYVAAFDVAIAPAVPDAPPWQCPLKLWDYRAQGRPIVAAASEESAAIVGSAGCLLPGAAPQAWAAAVRAARRRPVAPLVRTWDTVLSDATRDATE